MNTIELNQPSKGWQASHLIKFLRTERESSAESILRKKLNDHFSFHFERYSEVADTIADFHCERAKIIIEFESRVRNIPKEFALTAQKIKELENKGYAILKTNNREILNNIKGVIKKIEQEIEKRSKK